MLHCEILSYEDERKAPMTKAVLTISSRNYSSWALRAGLFAGFPGWISGKRCCPPTILRSGRNFCCCRPHSWCRASNMTESRSGTRWRSRNISTRSFPKAGLLPPNALPRTHCRAICGEMHSGFSNLRSALPMNLKASFPDFKIWAGAQGRHRPHHHDLARLHQEI